MTSSRSRREAEGVSAGLLGRDRGGDGSSPGDEREVLVRSPRGEDGALRPRLRLLFASLVGLILVDK